MELDEQTFLDEILSLRRDAWECSAMGDFFSPTTNCSFQEGHQPPLPPSVSVLPTFTASYEQQPPPVAPGFDCLYSPTALDGPNAGGDVAFLDVIQPKAPLLEEGVCKVESSAPVPAVSKKKRVEGMPSKNLMAERRRRKRLNDRLSMLRTVVPKISKMDRTSILGDTIEYMKELLERIKQLQEEILEQEGLLTELNPKEMMGTRSNTANKVLVERRKEGGDTRVEMYCESKPGLLLSTVTTLETLGLNIQQAVVSCFNEFGMHASCSDREMMSADMIKQELLKNTGYGGGCL